MSSLPNDEKVEGQEEGTADDPNHIDPRLLFPMKRARVSAVGTTYWDFIQLIAPRFDPDKTWESKDAVDAWCLKCNKRVTYQCGDSSGVRYHVRIRHEDHLQKMEMFSNGGDFNDSTPKKRKLSSSSSYKAGFVPTCDLYDEYLDTARVPTVAWRSFGGIKQFYGPVVTVKCFEDNSRVKELVETDGKGSVLVVDGGASMRCALLGDMLAIKAQENNWAGILIHGCVRDVAALSKVKLGVMALGSTPRKSKRNGEGQSQLSVRLGDVECRPNDLVFCDLDGVLILTAEQAREREQKAHEVSHSVSL
ncbi:regulator of ribonuclease activity A [Fistulifera solaris]|jgi:regulator of ribonuclease activity A|uniref:4-hydroxy-4-methyl-2-oxoglutarate aldolase n=1 Tax=Fistulifera solaris TaxID=1519565 RepID=A0A1Z5JMJ8_FISSO|nr:regulator of ribonuclease activity A [Fistulifera solaris]|eukprot:GAX15240.1 regulator of ribonuclease activity A [Fistulifera solaris]